MRTDVITTMIWTPYAPLILLQPCACWHPYMNSRISLYTVLCRERTSSGAEWRIVVSVVLVPISCPMWAFAATPREWCAVIRLLVLYYRRTYLFSDRDNPKLAFHPHWNGLIIVKLQRVRPNVYSLPTEVLLIVIAIFIIVAIIKKPASVRPSVLFRLKIISETINLLNILYDFLDGGSAYFKVSTYLGHQRHVITRIHCPIRSGFEPVIPVFERSKTFPSLPLRSGRWSCRLVPVDCKEEWRILKHVKSHFTQSVVVRLGTFWLTLLAFGSILRQIITRTTYCMAEQHSVFSTAKRDRLFRKRSDITHTYATEHSANYSTCR